MSRYINSCVDRRRDDSTFGVNYFVATVNVSGQPCKVLTAILITVHATSGLSRTDSQACTYNRVS